MSDPNVPPPPGEPPFQPGGGAPPPPPAQPPMQPPAQPPMQPPAAPPPAQPPGGYAPPPGQPPGGFAPPPAQPYGGGGASGGSINGQPLADPGKRLIARLIDFAIFGLLYAVVNFLLVGLAVASSGRSTFGFSFVPWLIGLAFLVLYWLYESYMASNSGQTVGKMVMKLKVVSTDGAPVTLQQGMKRSAAWLILVIPCCIGWIAFAVLEIWGAVNIFNSPTHQTPLDQFADTNVVDAA